MRAVVTACLPWLLLLLTHCALEPPFSVREDAIEGGAKVAECGWPSAVYLRGGSSYCSGTLIHPSWVLTAAHCGTGLTHIIVGETAGSGQRYDIVACTRHENLSRFRYPDLALCELATPASTVPLVPMLMGCEASILEEIGRPVVSVGFGQMLSGGAGIKRAVPQRLRSSPGSTGVIILLEGEDGGGACPGDSGGPSYIQLDDGTWRHFGVHRAALCGVGGMEDTLTRAGIAWMESHAGVDFTPCHDADGTWNPGPECGRFPTDPATGEGMQPNCGAGPLSGLPSSTCGAAYGATLDAGIVDAGIEADPDGEIDSSFDTDADAASEPDGVSEGDSGTETETESELDGGVDMVAASAPSGCTGIGGPDAPFLWGLVILLGWVPATMRRKTVARPLSRSFAGNGQTRGDAGRRFSLPS